MSLLLTLAEAAGGGTPIINDPSDIPNLTLEYKGGIDPAGSQEVLATSSNWENTFDVSSPLGASTDYNTMAINGIDVLDMDDALDRTMSVDTATEDAGVHPYGSRGVFTSIMIMKAPSVLGIGAFIYNYNDYLEANRKQFCRWVVNADYTLKFDMRALEGGTTYAVEPTNSALSAGEIKMMAMNFDYNTKDCKAMVDGNVATTNIAQYAMGSAGLNLRSLEIGRTNPTMTPITMITFDRILTNEELNKLGAYYSNRWGSTIWTAV